MTSNIESYDCEFAGLYFDNSYICVVQQYSEYFKGFITAIDEKDLTEIDEFLIILSIYFLGHVIHMLSETILEFFIKYRNVNMYVPEKIFTKYINKISHILTIYLSILTFLLLNKYSYNYLIILTVCIILSLLYIYKDIRLNKLLIFSDKNSIINNKVISDSKIEIILNSNCLFSKELINFTKSKKEFILYVNRNDFIDNVIKESVRSLTDSEYLVLSYIIKYKNENSHK